MNERAKQTWLVAGAIVLALLSVAGGALIALSDDGPQRAEPSRTPSASPSRTDEPIESPEPSPTPDRSESPVLGDGRHFVFADHATRRDDGSATVTFDLAYFYRGDRAVLEAEERGDEVVNDYYIVNDNPRLRTLSLADAVDVSYIPESACCEQRRGDVDAWLESVLETNPTDYPGKDVPWWITVRGGQIVRIRQQYLP